MPFPECMLFMRQQIYVHQDGPCYLNIQYVRVPCKVCRSRKPGDNYSPALKKWGLYWIHPVRHSLSLVLCHSVIIQCLLNILKTNKPIETKFCVHIIIDKIYVGIVNCCFSQICNRVMDLN